MPKIKIVEIDNTGSASAETENIVYIPGKVMGTKAIGPTLFSTSKALKAKASDYVDDLSFKMALALLDSGMQVLLQGFVPTGADTYVAGSFTTAIEEENEVKKFTINDVEYTVGNNTITPKDGEAINVVNGVASLGTVTIGQKSVEVKCELDFIHSIVTFNALKIKSGNIAFTDADWTVLEDRNLHNIRFLTLGGYADLGAAVARRMIVAAANRGDCVALVDHPTTCDTVAEIRAFFEGVVGYHENESDPEESYLDIDSDDNLKKNKGNAASFGAAFTPWINLEGMSESFPGSFGYLLAFASAIKTNPLWKAIAGSFRGVIPGLAKKNSTTMDFTTADCEVLQARAKDKEVELDSDDDNWGVAINPIALENPFGYLVWGNRTLKLNKGTLKASAVLNDRVMVADLYKTFYVAAKKYTFEQNNDILWVNYKSEVTPKLERMKSGEGIEDYELQRLATDKKARLKARCILSPIMGLEDWDLELVLTDSLEVVE